MKRHRIGRAAAERLLRGEPASAAHAPRVADVLAAASAPTGPDELSGELSGEAAAVAAFREARVEAAAARAGRLGRRGLLRARTAALVVVAVAVVGVGLAAGNDALHGQPPGPLVGSGGTPDDTIPPNTSVTTSGPSPHESPVKRGKRTPPGGATPSPSLDGLCRAYKDKPGSPPGKTLETPAFAALVKAAGGKERVALFCVKLLDDKDPDKKQGKGDPGRDGGSPQEPGDNGNRRGGPGEDPPSDANNLNGLRTPAPSTPQAQVG